MTHDTCTKAVHVFTTLSMMVSKTLTHDHDMTHTINITARLAVSEAARKVYGHGHTHCDFPTHCSIRTRAASNRIQK